MRIGEKVECPEKLLINRFSNLCRLRISIISSPRSLRFSGSIANATNDFIEHICETINQCPFLQDLSIIKTVRHRQDTSFRRLTGKLSSESTMLKSLHLAISDLKLNGSMISHLKSLTSLHIEGSANKISTGEDLWPLLAAANIHLQDITVWHLSGHLLDYLKTYSSLQKLHIKLIYQDGDTWAAFDNQVFIRQILPLHSLSPVFNEPSEFESLLDSQGLVFARYPLNWHPGVVRVLPQWDVTVCVDSVPHCLLLLVRFHTLIPSALYS